MQYRVVPKNGDELSALGYGCMRLPGKRISIDEELAARQIYGAIDRGVNYVDTAYPYHNGKSESFLGKILPRDGYRDKVKLATKLPHWSTRSKEEMEKVFSEQLDKLQTDHIDYYLVHSLTGKGWEKAKRKGVIDFLETELASGRIINAGFSFHGAANEFNQIVDDYDWTFCQIQYNFLDTANQAGTAGLQYAASKDMAVMIMEPLRGGNLAKKPPKEVQTVWDRSGRNWSAAEWALRWLYNHPEVTVVLSGMNDDAHIDENIRIASEATAESLTSEESALVTEAADAYHRLMKAECTGCQYCMPCPAGVNIPACFEAYNSYHMFKDRQAKLMYLSRNSDITSGKTSYASQCVECGKCLEKCPQELDIPVLLKDVKSDMEGVMTKPMVWFAKKLMRVRD